MSNQEYYSLMIRALIEKDYEVENLNDKEIVLMKRFYELYKKYKLIEKH